MALRSIMRGQDSRGADNKGVDGSAGKSAVCEQPQSTKETHGAATTTGAHWLVMPPHAVTRFQKRVNPRTAACRGRRTG